MPLKGGLVDGVFSKLFKIQLFIGAALIDPRPGLDIFLYLLGESVFSAGACIFCGKQFLGYRKAAVFSFCLLAFLAFLGNKEGNAAQA